MSRYYKDVKSFEIERSNWYRGKGYHESYLLNSQGQMCCLGFYALACGLSKEDIDGIEEPSGISNHNLEKWDSFLLLNSCGSGAYNATDCRRLIETNDSEAIDDEQRESIITKIFKAYNIDVKFKG